MTDEEDRITKQDLVEMQKRIAREANKKDNREGMLQAGRKGFNNVRKGLHDVAKSLNTPHTNKRPKISQLPYFNKRDDGNISTPINLDPMKHPSLRGRDLKGRKVN
jgi:hypothetical protein